MTAKETEREIAEARVNIAKLRQACNQAGRPDLIAKYVDRLANGATLAELTGELLQLVCADRAINPERYPIGIARTFA